MPENNPITDAELEELRRLHAAAKYPGKSTHTSGYEFHNATHAIYGAFPSLLARLEAAEREREELRAEVDRVRNVSAKWLADNNAKQRRIGAAEWLENAAREGGYYERSSEGMLEEAKQLREGK